MSSHNREKLAIAPILPLAVITRPMRKLPRTHAPIAIRQLSPTAIIDEAKSQTLTIRARNRE